MHRGYIKLWRCITENRFWQERPFDMSRAWIDLVILANYKPAVIWKRGIEIKVDRGQVGWSERQLAERWGWSRGKVQRFLKHLENDHQIEQQNGPENLNVTSLITITNYDKYQVNEPQTEPQTEPETGRKRAANRTMEKKEKKEKKEEEVKKEYAEKVLMTETQHGTLVEKHGEYKTNLYIQKLSISKCANSKMKYDSDYHAILKWVIAAVEKECGATGTDRPRSFREQVNRAAGDAFERGEY